MSGGVCQGWRRVRCCASLTAIVLIFSICSVGPLFAQTKAGDYLSPTPVTEGVKKKRVVRTDIYKRVPTTDTAPSPEDIQIPKSEQDAAAEAGLIPKKPEGAGATAPTPGTPSGESFEPKKQKRSYAKKTRPESDEEQRTPRISITTLLGALVALVGLTGWAIRKRVIPSSPPLVTMTPQLAHGSGPTISDAALSGPAIRLRARLEHGSGPMLHIAYKGET